MLKEPVEISQLSFGRPPSRLRLVPALLVKAGFGLSAFGRLPDATYMAWVFEVNGLDQHMRGALDHVKGPADLVLEAWRERDAKRLRVREIIASLRPGAVTLVEWGAS